MSQKISEPFSSKRPRFNSLPWRAASFAMRNVRHSALCLLLLSLAATTTAAAAAAAGDGADELARGPRWFLGGRTVTRVVLERTTVTERTPSSCVVVAPSLPPCRAMRALQELPDVQPARPLQVLATEPAVLQPRVESAQLTGAEMDSRARTLGRSWTRTSNTVVVAPPPSQSLTPPLPAYKLTRPYAPDVEIASPAQTTAAPESDSGWHLFRPDVTVTKVLREVETVKKVDPELMITFSVTVCKPTRLPFDLDLCPAAASAPRADDESADELQLDLDPREAPESLPSD